MVLCFTLLDLPVHVEVKTVVELYKVQRIKILIRHLLIDVVKTRFDITMPLKA